LRRVDKTFKAFFRRVKAGLKAGYPRFKSSRRFDSYTFPSYGDGCRLTGTRLYLQGVGQLKVKLHRPVLGNIKTITVKRYAGKWYVCFSRRKAVVLLQKAHAHVQHQRADFHHKTARALVDAYGVIAVEDLHIKGLASGMLAKSVNDAGWAAFITKLAYKAAEAGRKLMHVDPRGTSQTCLCGAPVPKTLSQRWHQCEQCGLSTARDHVSAQLILGLGLSLLGLT
jgi:putative transposase